MFFGGKISEIRKNFLKNGVSKIFIRMEKQEK